MEAVAVTALGGKKIPGFRTDANKPSRKKTGKKPTNPKESGSNGKESAPVKQNVS